MNTGIDFGSANFMVATCSNPTGYAKHIPIRVLFTVDS
jgi:hypothetical protein